MIPHAAAIDYNRTVFAHSVSIPENDSTADWHALWSALPASAAVFSLCCPETGPYAGGEPYIAKTANLRRRAQRLLSPDSKSSKRLNLAGRIGSIAYTETGSELETALLLYRTTRRSFGERARKRLHLRPPIVLRMAWENAYPRVYVTQRISARSREHTYGPFASRTAAERFLDDSLNLFLLRRCTDDLHPDPVFPGCVYSEMKMCLAPCFKGCTEERYAAEAETVRAYFATRGASLLAALEAERNAASAALDFETAAQRHARIQKVQAIVQQAAPLVHPLSQLNAVILQPAAQSASTDDPAGQVAVFLVCAGVISGPVLYSVQGMIHPNEHAGSSSLFAHPAALAPTPLQADAASTPKITRGVLEDRLRDILVTLQTSTGSGRLDSDCIADHLALLARWYYRPAAKRTGEIFFCDASGNFSYPKILRGISRVVRGAKNPEEMEPSLSTTPATTPG